ncbi:DUF2946 domain-containing protein [Paraburkholderia acidisoli]|uniref:DUF2946 domain-containing protein n=1 Tax=Paraburkholderia acidisoli TaxID=2571748 RepID=A0A7Z2GK20_9BURK|nr:DUF2946 domain-containing protein [Paraburkholderia acidisoli]QGZ63242.1 DUF2946 domain-containing protein [Paraburkholderia acidisoli]
MNLRKHSLLTAWAGLVAMWLIVLAPLVSQLVAAQHAHEPVSALCSALQPASNTPDVQHLSHDDAFGACGYCHLLEHHVAMPSVAVPEPMPALAVAREAVAPLSTRFVPLGAFPSGRPRAPPVVS